MFQHNMPPPVTAYQQGPTCFDQVKMGFQLGACIGLGVGVLYGGLTWFRGHGGGNGIAHVGKMMVQQAGTMGVFVSIAQLIRCR